MQLLDTRPKPIDTKPQQAPAPVSDRVLAALQDIANNVQIQSNFCISHPAYKPLELPAEMVSRFERIPLDLQNKYLSLQLQNFLYGIYYSGSLKTALAPDADSVDLTVQQNLENNTFLGVDLAFYNRLHESNSGDGYFDPDWSVLRQESDGTLAVTKGGLTLHIEPSRHLQTANQPLTEGDLVAIWMPRNLVQNGFYMAVGNAGSSKRGSSDAPPEIVRIYFNLSSEGAAPVMASLTQQLNEIGLPFSFKALYNPSDYERYDSAVLYFDRTHYPAARQVLQRVYAENQQHFQTETPLFTKHLAPGLALAEEPDQKFATVESFGMNRCQIVANGLLEAQQEGDDSTEYRMASIHRHFSIHGIDLEQPYLNADSEDTYTPFEL